MTTAPHSGPAATQRAVSVVVACDGAEEHLEERLDAIVSACRDLQAEIVVVAREQDAVRLTAICTHATRTHAVTVTLLDSRSPLVPLMWGLGIASAHGTIVVLTTTQLRARAGWLRALLKPFEDAQVVGVGGSIDLAKPAGMLGRAVYLIRYSEHLPSTSAAAPHDIAGENAAYRRDAVLSVCPDLMSGFWEVDVHRLLRAQGGRIVQARDAVIDFAPVLSWRDMLANRFVHGGHFGAYRVRDLKWPRWRALAVTPLVPMVLLLRILGRVRRAGGSLAAALSALPAMLPLLTAWACGEAVGALSRAGARNAK